MNRARRRALEIRRLLGLHGRVDAQGVADILNLKIKRMHLKNLRELKSDGVICIASRCEPEWARWLMAHAIGHELMHPGNHLWINERTGLALRYEREAEDFADALLLDPHEAVEQGLTSSREVADYFGVPEEVIRLQAPMNLH